MSALIVVTCVSLYLLGLRADRIHAGRAVMEPDQAQRGEHQSLNAPAKGAAPGSVTVPLYRGHSAAYYAWQLRVRTRQLHQARVYGRRRWRPTVDYAFRLASAVSGVSYWQLRSVAWCESTHNPFAVNGRYKGLFQLGWSPFGFSPFDPIANALSAALTVRADGSWRQWTCKP